MPSVTTSDRPLASSVDPLDEWFDRLLAHLPPDVVEESSPAEQTVLLDLARVAARHADRRAAPITTYLAGRAFAALPRTERLERLRELLRGLDAEA